MLVYAVQEGAARSVEVNLRTRMGPSSRGSHAPAKTAAVACHPSRVRGRANHRRTPLSVHDPARSPTISATWWSRAATASGVGRARAVSRRRLLVDTPTKEAISSVLRASFTPPLRARERRLVQCVARFVGCRHQRSSNADAVRHLGACIPRGRRKRLLRSSHQALQKNRPYWSKMLVDNAIHRAAAAILPSDPRARRHLPRAGPGIGRAATKRA